VDGNLRGRGGDVRLAYAAGDIYSVQQDAVAVDLGLKINASAVGKFEKRGLSAKARYIAPVSRFRKPKRRARWAARVLLPAPAGPSMAMTGR
jgi:hypothetical protein